MSVDQAHAPNLVGPVLRMGDDIDDIIQAIRDDNEDKDITIVDRGAYVRVHAQDRLRLTLESLQSYLGPDFELREIEAELSSFSGRINMGSDEIVWYLGENK